MDAAGTWPHWPLLFIYICIYTCIYCVILGETVSTWVFLFHFFLLSIFYELILFFVKTSTKFIFWNLENVENCVWKTRNWTRRGWRVFRASVAAARRRSFHPSNFTRNSIKLKSYHSFRTRYVTVNKVLFSKHGKMWVENGTPRAPLTPLPTTNRPKTPINSIPM